MLAVNTSYTVIWVAVAAAVLLVLVVLAVAAFRGGDREGVGSLDDEALRRDAARRAEQARLTAMERSGAKALVPATGGELTVAADTAVEPYAPEVVPPDAIEVGITRRMVLNRAAVGGTALFTGAVGLPCLAFLIPAPTKGFGGKIPVSTSIDDITREIENTKKPFYVSEARSYLMTYVSNDTAAAEKVYPAIWDGVKASGLMPLFQKCPHLGCKVPWCDSSQWFECPCHGSQYNSAGERMAGPAPRGLDRFEFSVAGGKMTIDTGKKVDGPPTGTDTIGQEAAGPHCV